MQPAVPTLTPVVTVVVHPIETTRHPNIPPGWRWAVMIGDGPPGDVNRCANAGWAPDRTAALSEGDRCGATAVRALRITGAPFAYTDPLILDHDPIATGDDRLHFA